MAKYRNGFVSNSSSSSFVLIVMKSEHEQVLAKFTDFERAVIKYAMEEAILLGIPVMVFHELNIMDYSSVWGDGDQFEYDDWPEDEKGNCVSVHDVFTKYQGLVHGFASTIYDG